MEQYTLTQTDQNSSLYAASHCQEVEADNYCLGFKARKRLALCLSLATMQLLLNSVEARERELFDLLQKGFYFDPVHSSLTGCVSYQFTADKCF